MESKTVNSLTPDTLTGTAMPRPYTGRVTITRATFDHLTAVIRDIADTHALARFGNLTGADISHKNPGDLVTVADTATETALTDALTAAVPGSVAVGEEACETNPALIDVLATDTPAWIIDPIDGTANYARGNPGYSTLVALARGGRVEASWLYAPSLKLSAHAFDGRAWIDDTPATAADTPTGDRLNLVSTHPNYTDGYHTALAKLDRDDITLTPCASAGLTYIDLINGRVDGLVYTWEKPWDHATGLHLAATLGIPHTTGDGTPFRLAGGNTLPLVTARTGVLDRLTALLA